MSFINVSPNIARLQPKLAIGGFSTYDGTIEFYARVSLPTSSKSRVLDLGAGRGVWCEDDMSDYVFEHVEDPIELGQELDRVLKSGGWVCARTPTKYNYVSLAARLISNLRHASVLKWVQPGRKAEDVFPTVYRLNSKKDVSKAFPPSKFEDFTYVYCFEPQYHFGSAFAYRLLSLLHRLLPASLHGNLYIFLRKR